MSNSESTSEWVTVADAAEKAQVDSGTVRQWYRAGRIPTRRSEGERGAFLVPLDLVLSLANPPDESVAAVTGAQPSIEDTLRTGPSTAETEALERELAEARDQLEFLRSQLAEVTSENRALKEQVHQADDQRADLRAQLADAVDDRKGVEARLLTVEAELTQLRRTAARGSITDNSWLDQETPAYQSPVRRQAMSGPPPGADPTPARPEDGPTAPFSEQGPSELADLLAATRQDDRQDGDAEPERAPFDDDRDEEYAASRAIWTDEAPHPPLGESPDDLLPEPEKKGRFGKK